MKVLVLFALVAAAAAWQLDVSELFTHPGSGPTDVPVAQKQRDINYLFYKVYEPLRDERLKTLANTFKPKNDISRYADGGLAVRRLMEELEGQRILKKKQLLSVLDTRQREEALMLFEVLMQCKDYETFISNAAYFRERMQGRQFAYTLYSTVKHSSLTEHIILPPVCEIIPHFYTDTEIIHEACNAKITSTPSRLNMSWTSTKLNPEQRVAYFTEDIGLSSYYCNWHVDYPHWWNDTYGYHIERKGEIFFWMHHQLMNRFDAERISNYLNTVEKLRLDKPLEEGFAPQTSYRNGVPFPSRPDNINLEDVEDIGSIQDLILLENRIRDAIHHGYITAKDSSIINIRNERGVDILGDVIESSLYSPNAEYYGSLTTLARKVMARQADPKGKYGMPPSVMEHYPTAIRDPSFYKLHKRIDNLFREHKDSLPPYMKKELVFPGVAINNIYLDGSLETYLEDYEYNLVNAVYDRTTKDDVEISTYMPRLNHKEFSYNIELLNNNEEEILATVRIFAWPLRDTNGVKYSFDEGRWRAIEMDKFMKQLTPGKNQIVRKSTDSSVTVRDVPSTKTLFDRAEEALASGTDMNLEKYEIVTGLPNRLLLPKGNEAGVEFMMMVAVTDGAADVDIDELSTMNRFSSFGSKGVYPDKKPHGFPLDRRVPDERVFYETPNIQGKIIKIYNYGEYLRYQ